MVLKWKRTHVKTSNGLVTVTHWVSHRASSLLMAVSSPPVEIKKGDPAISLHDFGKHRLAVREFNPHDIEFDPPTLFENLRRTVRRHAAIVEMPVALIHRPAGYRIVTLWKKGDHAPLPDFLKDSAVSPKLKERACLEAVSHLAKLHSIKLAHGHPKPGNFITDKRGNCQLVDYTRLGKYSYLSEEPEGNYALPDTLSRLVYRGTGRETELARVRLRSRLQREYEERKAQYSAIAAKRRRRM